MKHSKDILQELMLPVKKIIINIIKDERNVLVSPESIEDDEDISTSTVLQMNSLMAIRVVVELEKRFGLEIPDEDLDMENFKSVRTIADYIQQKKEV